MNDMVFSHRAFRKQYFRAKRAHQALARKGAFTLRFAAQAATKTATTQFTTPDDAGAVRFALLMRPFLDPRSAYHYRKVFEQIAAEAPDRISGSDRAAVEEDLAALEAGDLPLAINDQVLKAQDLYALLAQGEFFEGDVEALDRLRQLRAIPLIGPLMWYHFYAFSVSIYHHVGRLYQLSWEVRRSRANDTESRPSSKCIFCKRSDVTVTSEEHILPEALGNDEMVLPPGVVCDACNNAFSALDRELVEFPPIAMLRVMYVPHTKKGNLPSAEFEGQSIRKTHPRRLEIRTRGKAPEPIAQPDGSVRIDWAFQSTRPFDVHRLARALFKIGLELVAYDCGPQVALEPRYDPAREFVLGTRSTFPNHFFVCTQGVPRPEIHTTQFATIPGTLTLIDMFGVMFAFHLECNPPLDPSKLPASGPLTAFDLGISPRRATRSRTQRGDQCPARSPLSRTSRRRPGACITSGVAGRPDSDPV